MDGVPLMVQGIWWTIKQIGTVMKHEGFDEDGNWSVKRGYNAVKTSVLCNEVNRRNCRKLLRDILIGLIFASIFKHIMREMYQTHKKESNGEDIISNGIIELVYKSTTNSFDTFLGPLAVLNYIGNQTNPATYSVSSKVVNDLFSYVVGDKTIG
jgi:hypothetical protein